VDSHFDVPTVDVPLDVLHKRELAPFAAAIKAGVRSVMTAHVRVPVVTGAAPATLSRSALTDLLRGELGFDGVVITDSMEMAAVRGTVGMADGAVLALAAGADLLCTGGELRGQEIVEPIVDAIVRAVEDGQLAAERLADAAARVRALASWPGTDDAVTTDGQVGLQAARQAARILDGVPTRLQAPLVVELQSPPGMAVGPAVPWGLAPSLSALLPGTEVCRVTELDANAPALASAAEGRSLVVVTRDAHRYTWQYALVAALAAIRPDVVVVEMGLPAWRPAGAAAFIATYGAGRSNARAAAELLSGV
jgi:beta-N-acetylhexosaminidase